MTWQRVTSTLCNAMNSFALNKGAHGPDLPYY